MGEVEDLKRELEEAKHQLKELQVELVKVHADAWADGELTLSERFELEQLSNLVELAKAIRDDLELQIRETSADLASHEASHAVQQEVDAVIADIEEAAKDAADAVEEAARESDDAVEEAAEDAAEAIDEAAKDANDAVEQAARDAADAAKDAAKEAEAAVDEAARQAEEAIEEAKQAAHAEGAGSEDGFTPPEEANEPTLRKGDESMDGWVEYLQQTLNYHLGKGTVTISGTFDQATDKAVRKFQEQAGCKVDGIVGNQTWSALREDKVLAEIGTDNRKPGEFVEMGAEARWVTEGGSAFSYTESKDTILLLATSVGTEPIVGFPVDIFINGERRKSVIQHSGKGPDDPVHLVMLEEVVARHGAGPFKIEAYLPQELGGDKWEGQLEEQGGGGDEGETFELVATFVSEVTRKPLSATVLVELAGGPQGFKAPPRVKLGEDGIFTASVPNGKFVLLVKVDEGVSNFIVDVDGADVDETFSLSEPIDDTPRVVLTTTVVDAKSGEAQEGVAVFVDGGPDNFTGHNEETGKDGQVAALVPVDADYDVTIVFGGEKELSRDVKVGTSDVNVDFKIDAGGAAADEMVTMTVNVVDETGKPVENANATVASNNPDVFFEEGALLGADGILELDVPANVEYTVSAEFQGATDKKTVKVGGGPVEVGLKLNISGGADPKNTLKMDVEDYNPIKKQMAESFVFNKEEVYDKGVKNIDAFSDQSDSRLYRNALDAAFEDFEKEVSAWNEIADDIIEIQKNFEETAKSNPGKAKADLERARSLDSDAKKKSEAIVAALTEMSKVQQSAEKELSGTKWDLADYRYELGAVKGSFEFIKKQHDKISEMAKGIEDEEIKTIRLAMAKKYLERFEEKFKEWRPICEKLANHQSLFESKIDRDPAAAVENLKSAHALVNDERKPQESMRSVQSEMNDLEKQVEIDLKGNA